MAATTAKLGRERTLSTLAKRLFVIEGPDAERKLKHAEAALLLANPELATPEGFASGRTVIVPGTIGLVPTERVSMPERSAQGLLDETTMRLDGAGAVLARCFAVGAKRDAETLTRITDRTFTQKMRRALPESTGLLPAAKEALARRTEEDKTRAESFAKAVEDAHAALEQLRTLAEHWR